MMFTKQIEKKRQR